MHLVVGEIRTCLLHNTTPLPGRMAEQLLELLPGRRPVSEGQPVSRSRSPLRFTGIDCRLATKSGARARGVGTVASQMVITEGTVLQGSVTAALQEAEVRRRLPWSHYANRPGRVEVISKAGVDDLVGGFLADLPDPETLDLGSVSERTIGGVQAHPALDHVTLFRSRPMSVRWAARVAPEAGPVPTGPAPTPRAAVRVVNESVRTIELTVVDPDQLEQAARFCEDYALHDWLLATLKRVIEQSDRLKVLDREPIKLLRTAVELLLHLWMPGAQVAEGLLPLWDALERRAGLTRQWESQVAHIRDQIALRTLWALERSGVHDPAV